MVLPDLVSIISLSRLSSLGCTDLGSKILVSVSITRSVEAWQVPQRLLMVRRVPCRRIEA